MKRVLRKAMAIAGAGLLIAGCARNEIVESLPSDNEVVLTVEAGLPDVATKAVADVDGNARKVNHWIMEVLDKDGKLFYREVKTPAAGTLQQTFKVSLIKNQTYDILFWADNNGGFYNTDTLTKVSLANLSYTGNNDARDAFTACKSGYKSTASETISATLYRPFGQLNVITTDLEKLWKDAKTVKDSTERYLKFEPKNYIMTAKLPTSFNVKTQSYGDSKDVVVKSDLSYTAYESDSITARQKNNYKLHKADATLFMDYVFASKSEKDLVSIDFSFKTNGDSVGYTFTNIPLKANYRTNIKGQLLSNDTEWTVNISETWTKDTTVVYPNAN